MVLLTWNVRRAAVFAALFFWASVALAHHECPEGEAIVSWSTGLGGHTGTGASAGEACSALEAEWAAANPSHSWSHQITGSFTHTTYQNCKIIRDGNQTVGSGVIVPECAVGPGPCDAGAGSEAFARWDGASPEDEEVCGHNSSGAACKWTLQPSNVAVGVAGGSMLGNWQQTNEECAEGDAHDSADVSQSGGVACIAAGSDIVCAHDGVGENCGTFNGQEVCLGDAPPGHCTFFGDGSAVCDPDAPTPPTPDNGVPGIKASPDMSVSDPVGGGGPFDGDVIDFFSTGTVAGSSNSGGDNGDYEPPADGDDCVPGTDCPAEWVDRNYDPGDPGDFSAFEAPTAEELGGAMPAVDYSTQGEEWSTFFRDTFPFSLVAGPISSFATAADAPEFDYETAQGHFNIDLSVVDSLATMCRTACGLLMLWGFWWVVVETLWKGF